MSKSRRLDSNRQSIKRPRPKPVKNDLRFCSYRYLKASLLPLSILLFWIEIRALKSNSTKQFANRNGPTNVSSLSKPQQSTTQLRGCAWRHHHEIETRQIFAPTPIWSDEHNPENHSLNITISQKWIDYFQSLGDFPKVVHVIWPDKNVLDKNDKHYDVLEHGIKNLQRINPDWKVRIHDYDDVRNKIQTFRHRDIPQSMKDVLENAHIVEQTDAYRAILMYEEGGLYVDIDRAINKKLSEAIGDLTKVKIVLPTSEMGGFLSNLHGSSPKNEIFMDIFRQQCEMRERMTRKNGWISKKNQLKLMEVHSAALEEALFGELLSRNKDQYLKAWDEARHAMMFHSGGTIVTAKDTKCDGLLVNDFDECPCIRWKSLYNAYNITSWEDELEQNYNDEDSITSHDNFEGSKAKIFQDRFRKFGDYQISEETSEE